MNNKEIDRPVFGFARHPLLGNLRSINIEGEWWYVAKDLAMMLQYSETAAMARWVPEEYKRNVTHLELLTSRTQRRATTVISIAGINYILKASKKKHAKILRAWIDDGEMQLSHMQKDVPVEEAEAEEVVVEEIPAEKAGNDVIIDKSLQIFSNPEFGDLRVIMLNGEPWFIAGEVAKELGYVTVSKAIARHCKGVAKRNILTQGGLQQMSIISEGDLYRLVMRSNLPRAEEFQDWVVGVVLPAIRKTGAYMPEEWLKKMMLKVIGLVEKQSGRLNRIEQKINHGIQEEDDEYVTPEEDVPEFTDRMRLVHHLRAYSMQNEYDYDRVWEKFYLKFKYLYHLDARSIAQHNRSKGLNLKAIDVIDNKGKMKAAYNMAVREFPLLRRSLSKPL